MKRMGSLSLFVSCLVPFILGTGCSGRVEFETGEVTLRELKLPEGCQSVSIRGTIEQTTPKGKTTITVEPQSVSQENTPLGGDLMGIDLAKDLKITITVVSFVGPGCQEAFSVGDNYTFEGRLKKDGAGKFSVSLKSFTGPPR